MEPGDPVVIAAHAEVEDDTGREEGAWGDGDRFVERGNWAMYFTYVVQEEVVDPMCGPQTTPPSKCVFVTSMGFSPDLVSAAAEFTGRSPTDGLAAGDAIYQALTESDGSVAAQGTYKAWLSTTGEGNSAFERLAHSVDPYRLVVGTLVANDFVDLTTCPVEVCLQEPIDHTQDKKREVLMNGWTETASGGPVTGLDNEGWRHENHTSGDHELATEGSSDGIDALRMMIGPRCASLRPPFIVSSNEQLGRQGSSGLVEWRA